MKLTLIAFFIVFNFQLNAENTTIIGELWKAKTVLAEIQNVELHWAIDDTPFPFTIIERRQIINPHQSNIRLDFTRNTNQGLLHRTQLNNQNGAFQIIDGEITEATAPTSPIIFPNLQAAYKQATWKTPAPGTSWEIDKEVDYFGHPCVRITFNYPILNTEQRKQFHTKVNMLKKDKKFDANLLTQLSKAIYYITHKDNFIVGYETYDTEGEQIEKMRILKYVINHNIPKSTFNADMISKEHKN